MIHVSDINYCIPLTANISIAHVPVTLQNNTKQK